MSLNSVKKNVIHREGRRSVHWIRWQKRKFTEFSDEFFTGGYSAHIWIKTDVLIVIDIADFHKYLIQRQSTGLGLTQTISSYFCLSLILGQVWIRLGSRIKGFSSLHFQKDILINLSQNLVFFILDSKWEHFQFLQNQIIIKNSENQRIFK